MSNAPCQPRRRACPIRQTLPVLVSVSLLVNAVWGIARAADNQRELASRRSMMVEAEVAASGIKQPAILASMRSVPRHEFVPAESRAYAYLDMALPIGEHQTISPPFIVAYMTAQLDPRPPDRVLEIGTGSGYQAAVLSALVKDVYTIEISRPLAERSTKALKRLGYRNVHAMLGDGFQGWAEHAPFDKIIVTCSPEKVPQPLVDQLREGGKIVIPLGERYQQTLYTLRKEQGRLRVESREPTFFVPMTGRAESLRVTSSDAPLTPLVNGDFATLLDAGQPAGWYYARQATIEKTGPEKGGQHSIRFVNRVPGRGSQVLQAIGVDGRRVPSLAVELWVKVNDVEAGQTPDQRAKMLISFFDEDRVPVGQQAIGPWDGSFAWQRRSAHVAVPPQARVAIVAIGLLGATGELSCSQLTLRAATEHTAGRP